MSEEERGGENNMTFGWSPRLRKDDQKMLTHTHKVLKLDPFSTPSFVHKQGFRLER